MSSTETGRMAEGKVASYLTSKKHKIIAMNWRTRWCEIDVISKDKKCVYFTEVKFRGSDSWGEGIEYITAKKLKQMKFAADFWIAENKWNGEALLQVASVDKHFLIDITEIV